MEPDNGENQIWYLIFDDDDDNYLGAFQGRKDNWMTGEAEIPATLAFLDIGADISHFYFKIFPFREAINAKKSQNCGIFPYGGGGLNPIP